MCKFSIEFDETDFSQIEDIYNGNTEICVTFEDVFDVTITVATPKNIEFLLS